MPFWGPVLIRKRLPVNKSYRAHKHTSLQLHSKPVVT